MRSEKKAIRLGIGVLTGMGPFVDLEVLRPGKHFSAPGKRARERLLSRVDTDVVDKLVLGLEGLSLPHTVLPETRVVGNLRPAHVLHSDMRDNLMHRAEHFHAGFLRHPGRQVLVDPHAGHLLLNGVPHVAEESTWSVVSHANAVGRGVHLVA